jgi:hypothetical protein
MKINDSVSYLYRMDQTRDTVPQLHKFRLGIRLHGLVDAGRRCDSLKRKSWSERPTPRF